MRAIGGHSDFGNALTVSSWFVHVRGKESSKKLPRHHKGKYDVPGELGRELPWKSLTSEGAQAMNTDQIKEIVRNRYGKFAETGGNKESC